MSADLDADSRRASIQDAVARNGFVRLSDLSKELGVAPVTIHRDLDQLAAEGVVARVRGGARSMDGHRHEIHTEFNLRRKEQADAKAAIASRALAEVPDGAILFFDSSTTVLALALALEDASRRGVTVVTNSPGIAFQLHAPYVHVIVTPGELDQSLRAITGTWTVEFLAELEFTAAFVSAGGLLLESGLMTTRRDLADVTRAVFSKSARRIALIDSSKFNRPALMPMAGVGELDLVITDPGLEPDALATFRKAGLDVVIAGETAPEGETP